MRHDNNDEGGNLYSKLSKLANTMATHSNGEVVGI